MPRDYVEEAPSNSGAFVRENEVWKPGVEEAPLDGKSFVRQKGTWTEVAAEERIEYGIGLFEHFDGQGKPLNKVDLKIAGRDGEIGGVITFGRGPTNGLELDPNTGLLTAPLATDVAAGSIVEPPPDDRGYVRRRDIAGVSQWVPPADTPLPDFGTGLTLDETATPQIVHLQPAGDSPATLGGVYVIDRVRNNTEGLELGADGRLRVPLATDSLAGAMLEPPLDDKGYVRTYKGGVGAWVPPADTPLPDFGIGLSLDETASPNMVNLTPAGWAPQFLGGVYTTGGRSATQGLDLAAAGTGEISVPLATDLLAGAIVEPAPDDKQYIRTRDAAGTSSWELLPDSIGDVPPHPPIIWGRTTGRWVAVPTANPAGHTRDDIGVIYVPARSPGQGLELSGDGMLRAPLATPDHAGAITEPRETMVPHARVRDETTGISSWEPLSVAGHTKDEIGVVFVPARSPGQGLELGDDGMLRAPLATDMHAGAITEPSTKGKLHGRVRDDTTGISSWEQIPDSIGDVPPYPPIIWGRTTGRWVEVPTASIAGNTKDEIGVVYVPARSPGQGLALSSDGMLRAPLATDMHAGTITEPHETTVPHARVRDEITGISTWEPLSVAGHTKDEIGVVYVPARSPGQGLALSSDGMLRAPLATPDHAGAITEPRETTVPHARVRDETTGISTWEPLSVAGHTKDEIGLVYVPARSPGQGLALSSDGMLRAPLATPDHAGAITEPRETTVQHARVRDDTTGISSWEPIPDNTLTVVARSMLQGLEYDLATNTLWAPLATDKLAGAIVEPPLDDRGYVRTYKGGVGAWVPPADTPLPDFGTGLSLDETQTPQIVHLQPAGDSPATLGGVYVVDRVRNVSEGLELGADGRLRAPLATDNLAGTILEPPLDDKGYVRTYKGGVGAWVPPADTPLPDFGTGLSLDETQTPPLVNLQPAGDSAATLGGVYVVDRVRNVSEGLELGADGRLRAPLATDNLAGTILEPPLDDKGYVRTYKGGVGAWVPPADTPLPDFGTGLTLDETATPQIVHLQPAGPQASMLGGVYVPLPDRDATQGLLLNPVDGQLSAPLATDKLAGAIVEPPPDDKQYVRMRDINGISSWVPAAMDALIVSDTAPMTALPNQLWWDSDSGDLFVNYQDADSTQWVMINIASSSSGTGGTGGVEEAPIDGKPYARMDAGWTLASASTAIHSTLDWVIAAGDTVGAEYSLTIPASDLPAQPFYWMASFFTSNVGQATMPLVNIQYELGIEEPAGSGTYITTATVSFNSNVLSVANSVLWAYGEAPGETRVFHYDPADGGIKLRLLCATAVSPSLAATLLLGLQGQIVMFG